MILFSRILQVLLLLLIIQPLSLSGSDIQENGFGHLLGVYFTALDQSSITNEELEAFEEMGFSIFEVEGTAPGNFLDYIKGSGISLFIQQPRPFVVSHQMQEKDSLYQEQDVELIQFYRREIGYKAVAFGLFLYPDDRRAANIRLLDLYAGGISERLDDDVNIYYRSAFSGVEEYPASFSFWSTRMTGRTATSVPVQVIHFAPADTSLGTLNDMVTVFQLSLQAEQSVVLLPYEWLKNKMNRYELLENTLEAYIHDTRVLFPQPNEPKDLVNVNWIVILLILLIGSYVVHYHNNPTYQRSLFRYFTMHNFFTEDLLENRIRFVLPGVALFFQHVVLGGMFFYIVFTSFVSPLGLQVLAKYFPTLFLFGISHLGVFASGLLVTFLLQSISAGWIHLTNRKTRLSNVVTLYSWPLQLNLIIVLVMIVLYLTSEAGRSMAVFSILFIIIWFFSFNISALSIAKHLRQYRVIYIILTVGIHVLLLGLLITAGILYPPLSEPLSLAISIP